MHRLTLIASAVTCTPLVSHLLFIHFLPTPTRLHGGVDFQEHTSGPQWSPAKTMMLNVGMMGNHSTQ